MKVKCIYLTLDFFEIRSFLEEEETVIEHLEQKLDKAIKMCTIAVDSGKEYVKNQR